MKPYCRPCYDEIDYFRKSCVKVRMRRLGKKWMRRYLRRMIYENVMD